MKKNVIIFISLMLTLLFVACDVKSDDKSSESNISLENTSDEEKIQDDRDAKEEEAEVDLSIIDEKELANIVDLSSVINISDFSYENIFTKGDGDNLIANITVYDNNKEKIQELSYQTYFTQEWYDMYSENDGEICRFIDYNFDGYTDIVTQQSGAMVNQYYGMWIYNSQTEKFDLSEEYSGKSNPQINIEKEYFLTTNYDKGIPSYELSHVERGHLGYLGSIQGIIDESGKVVYVQRMYGYIDENGNLANREVQSVIEINSESELDELWKAFEVKLY